jgi:hypothetical protein
VAREFVEVETGKGSDALDWRPQLKAALAAASKLTYDNQVFSVYVWLAHSRPDRTASFKE